MKSKVGMVLLSTLAVCSIAALVVVAIPQAVEWPDWLAALPLFH